MWRCVCPIVEHLVAFTYNSSDILLYVAMCLHLILHDCNSCEHSTSTYTLLEWQTV